MAPPPCDITDPACTSANGGAGIRWSAVLAAELLFFSGCGGAAGVVIDDGSTPGDIVFLIKALSRTCILFLFILDTFFGEWVWVQWCPILIHMGGLGSGDPLVGGASRFR